MHIVYVCREYPTTLRMGGIAAYLKEISTAMVKRGHKVTVICANDDTRYEIKEVIDGVNVIRLSGGDFVIPAVEPKLSFIKKFRVFYRFFSYRKKIRKTILNMDGIDVIEIPEFGAEGYYLTDIDIPITIRLHTPTLLDRRRGGVRNFSISFLPEYWIGRKELQLLKKFKNISSCSQSLLNWCKKNIPSFSAVGETIYNPIDTASWLRSEIFNYNENTIFYAGTVAEEKGVGDLVKAVALLNKNDRTISLKIAGKIGKYGAQLKATCETKGYSWCEFLGQISREELRYYYQLSKVSCFPSWWENLPMVCLEAMATGNIVIGSKNGGMSEMIYDEVDGFLIEPREPIKLAELLNRALQLSSQHTYELGINAHNKIQNMFSTTIIAEKLEKHYNSLKQ